VAAAADKRGLKRICMSCSTRFYDLSKRPIVCPNCSTEFVGDIKVKAKRGRVAEAVVAEAKAVKAVPAAEEEEVDPNRQVVSLDEAAELEKSGDDEDEDAITLDDEDEIEEIDEDEDDLEEDLDIKVEDKA
jgi:uncharacterized protein (TIGR02300 family)